MSVVYCSVHGCTTKRGNGLSFFRCPKDEARCQIWKRQLGFCGDHKYAKITPEQCYQRIKICSLHFTDDSFTTEEKQRLNCNAVPSLFLSRATSTTNLATISRQSVCREHSDAWVQTDITVQKSAFVQTDVRLKYDQGRLQEGSCTSPSSQPIELTDDDVIRYLDENCPPKLYTFLKTQLLFLRST